MRHDSEEFIHIPITGTTGWSNVAMQVSIDDGTTWHDATALPETVKVTMLPSGVVGEKAVLRILSTDLGSLAPGDRLDFLVRITAQPEIPVIRAGSLRIT